MDPVLHCDDNNVVLDSLQPDYVDNIVTDPPYSIRFMSSKWDYELPSVDFWGKCLRVAKPGANLLCFGGPRTFHRVACNIEDAGWELRDCLMYCFGTGLPKGQDLSKAIDRAAGAERELGEPNQWQHVMGERPKDETTSIYGEGQTDKRYETIPATDEARLWNGWHTSLKPAFEPVLWAMKPTDGTFVENALKWGVAGLNIDECRLPINPEVDDPRLGGKGSWSRDKTGKNVYQGGWAGTRGGSSPLGRYPSNVILDELAAELLDEQTGTLTSGTGAVKKASAKGYSRVAYGTESRPYGTPCISYGDSGGASRFFYVTKASKNERNEGLPDGMTNNHPTVKCVDLMERLCKIVKTPHGGIILDPFMGSGSTGVAAVNVGCQFIGIERETGFFEIAKHRIEYAQRKRAMTKDLFE